MPDLSLDEMLARAKAKRAANGGEDVAPGRMPRNQQVLPYEPRTPTLEQALAQGEEFRNRSVGQNIGAAYDAEIGSWARAGASLGNAIPQGLLDLTPIGWNQRALLALAGDEQPSPFERAVSDQTAEMISGGAREAQANVGPSQTSRFTQTALGLAPWLVPATMPMAIARSVGNRRLDVREAGGSELKADFLGGLQGGTDIVSMKLGNLGAARLGTALTRGTTPKIGATLGRGVGATGQHALSGATSSAYLSAGSAGISKLAGDDERAAAEWNDIPHQMLVGAVLGPAIAGAGAALRQPGRIAEARRGKLLDEARINAEYGADSQDNTGLAPMTASQAVAMDIAGRLPQMAGQPAPRLRTVMPRDGQARREWTQEPGVETPPDAVMREQGAAELARMDAQVEARRQHEIMVADAQENLARQEQANQAFALRQQHAEELARLGYPVDPTAQEPYPDPIVQREQRRAIRSDEVQDAAQTRLETVQSEEVPAQRVQGLRMLPAERAIPTLQPAKVEETVRPEPPTVMEGTRTPFGVRIPPGAQRDPGVMRVMMALRDMAKLPSGLRVPKHVFEQQKELLRQEVRRAMTPRQHTAEPPPAPEAVDPERQVRAEVAQAVREGRMRPAEAAATLRERLGAIRNPAVEATREAASARQEALQSEETPVAHEDADVAAPDGGTSLRAPVSDPPAAPERSPEETLFDDPAPVAKDRPELVPEREMSPEEALMSDEPAPAGGVAKATMDAQAERAKAPVPAAPGRGAAPVTAAERQAAPAATAVAEPEGADAPTISAPADATPLPAHAGLVGPRLVLDPSRRPEPEPTSQENPENLKTALGAIQPYKGNKRAAYTPVSAAVRSTLGADATKITEVYDPFGGGGGYALAISLGEMPNARKLTVGEITPGRLAKIRFIQEKGSILRQRALETGVHTSLRKVWERMKIEGHAGSGGGVQGRVSDRVIEWFYGPDGDGTKTLPEGVDPVEAKALMYAYVDAMERGVKPEFNDLVVGAEVAAKEGEIAATDFRNRGGDSSGRIHHEEADAFTRPYPRGPHVAIFIDGPYVGTTGYGAKRATVADAVLYEKIAKLVEDARERGNTIIYTDEVWWAKGDPESPKVSPAEGQRLDPILQRVQAATDRWTFYPVGRRIESVSVTNGFRPGERRAVSTSRAAERAAFQAAHGPGAKAAAPGADPTARAKSAVTLKAKPVEGVVEQRLTEQAEKDLEQQRFGLAGRQERGQITAEKAADLYQKRVEEQVNLLRQKLPPEERQANDIERATTERKATLPPDPKGERRAAMKAALEERKLPGEVVDHALGVQIKFRNGKSMLWLDAEIPEKDWNARNWLASMIKDNPAEFTALTKQVYGKVVDGPKWLKMPRTKQLELMRKKPPVAGLFEADGRTMAYDADFVVRAGKVIDKLISGGDSVVHIDEEITQAIWRLMPEGDRQIVLPQLRGLEKITNTQSAEAEEAFVAWFQQRRASLKPINGEGGGSLLGRILRKVRSFLSQMGSTAEVTPLVDKSVAEQVYQRVKGGDYLAGTPEAIKPAASLPGPGAGEAPATTRQAAGPRERFSLEREEREGIRAERKDTRESRTDEDIQHGVAERQRQLGGVNAQRTEANRIADAAIAQRVLPRDDDVAFLRAVGDDLSKALLKTGSPDVMKKMIRLYSGIDSIASEMGAAFRQFRYDLKTENGRQEYAHYNIFQLRGRDKTLYQRAIKRHAKAVERGQTAAAERAEAEINELETKSQAMHERLRETIKRKHDIDIASDNLGAIFRSRYALDNLLSTVSAHRADWTIADMLTTSFRQGVLSFPGTVLKNLTGNVPNYAWQVGVKPALETIMGQRSLGELGAIYKGMGPGLKMAWDNMIASYRAGHDVIEEAAVNTRTGIGTENVHGSAPSILQATLGINLSYISNKPHAAIDAFFKAWAGYSFVASEAHKVAVAEGKTGDAISSRIEEIMLSDRGSDGTGSWERGYRQAKKVTFQDTFDKELTPEGVRRMVQGLSSVANWRTPALGSINKHAVDFQPLVTLLPFIGTPFGIVRQAAQKLPPFQALKMISRWARGDYKDGLGHTTWQGDAAELILGTAIGAGLMGIVDKDDDKTLITGSEPDWKSGESKMGRRNAGPPPRSVKLAGKWYPYDAIQPFASVVAPMVDWMRGKGIKQAAGGLRSQWLLEQSADAFDMIKSLKEEHVLSPSDWLSKDPEIARETAKATRDIRHFVTSSVAGIAVPNILRRSLNLLHDRKTGVVSPRQTSKVEEGESVAGLVGKNLKEQLLPGWIEPFPKPITDLYGRDVRNAVSTNSDFALTLFGLSTQQPDPVIYDRMLMRWNKRVAEEGLKDKNGKTLKYLPDNWSADFTDRRGAHHLDSDEYREFAQAAGGEFLSRLDRAGFNLDDPTERDIKRYKKIKDAVSEWAKRRASQGMLQGAP